jgi:hypothetical protein
VLAADIAVVADVAEVDVVAGAKITTVLVAAINTDIFLHFIVVAAAASAAVVVCIRFFLPLRSWG